MALIDGNRRYIKLTPVEHERVVEVCVTMYEGERDRVDEKSVKEKGNLIVRWLFSCHDELYAPVSAFLESIGIDPKSEPQEGDQKRVMAEHPEIISIAEDFNAKDVASQALLSLFMGYEAAPLRTQAILPIVAEKFDVPQDSILGMASKYSPNVVKFSTSIDKPPVPARAMKVQTLSLKTADDSLVSYVYDFAKANDMFFGTVKDV